VVVGCVLAQGISLPEAQLNEWFAFADENKDGEVGSPLASFGVLFRAKSWFCLASIPANRLNPPLSTRVCSANQSPLFVDLPRAPEFAL
jgi:hypothetical protein